MADDDTGSETPEPATVAIPQKPPEPEAPQSFFAHAPVGIRAPQPADEINDTPPATQEPLGVFAHAPVGIRAPQGAPAVERPRPKPVAAKKPVTTGPTPQTSSPAPFDFKTFDYMGWAKTHASVLALIPVAAIFVVGLVIALRTGHVPNGTDLISQGASTESSAAATTNASDNGVATTTEPSAPRTRHRHSTVPSTSRSARHTATDSDPEASNDFDEPSATPTTAPRRTAAVAPPTTYSTYTSPAPYAAAQSYSASGESSDWWRWPLALFLVAYCVVGCAVIGFDARARLQRAKT